MRNNIVFNGKVLDLRQIIDLIKLRIASWCKAKWSNCIISMTDAVRFPNEIKVLPKVAVPRVGIMWKNPSIGSLKFNVDGSSKGKPGPAGIGGVLRDCSGKVKVIFSKAIGLADSNVAELLAVREALRIFLSSKWVSSHRLIIENDSSNVVECVLYPQGTPWALKKIMSQIVAYKAMLIEWDIMHILREGNDIADGLAKSGVYIQSDLLVYYE